MLAVSPVMDNYEQLDKDGRKNLITIFQEVNFCQVNISCGAHGFHSMVPTFEKKNYFSNELGENLLYANLAKKLHSAKYAYRW